MEEFRNKEYYEKLDEKGKIRYHKLYLKYKQNEEKVMTVMEYEKKIEKISLPCIIVAVIVIALLPSDVNEIYMTGEISGLKYLMLFIAGAIPTGMDIYKYLFIVKELNKNISIVLTVILSYLASSIAVGIIESMILFFITL